MFKFNVSAPKDTRFYVGQQLKISQSQILSVQKVTIGIPSYNEAGNIKALLDRILSGDNHAFQILEIIISDDSTDETCEIVRDYCSSRHGNNIRLFHHDKRRGAASAWNEIIYHAQGNLIILYDADVLPDTNCTKELISSIDGNVVMCASNPLPVLGKGIASRGSVFIGKWLERVRSKQLSQYTVMGRGLALQSQIAKKIVIPSNTIAIDLYLQNAVLGMGYNVAYNKNARLSFIPASTFEDFSSQFMRAINGHNQLAEMNKRTNIHLNFRMVITSTVLSAIKDPMGAVSTGICFLLLPYFLTRIDNFNTALWSSPRSTKNS